MSPFLFGLLFGMATAFPVGVQSFVVLNQGLMVGYPRVFFGIVTASCCDTLLILLGAAGVSAILYAPGSREALILVGVVFLLVMGIIGSLQVFTQIFVMTSGGPVNKTTVMVYYMYLWAFKYYDMGYASTLAFALFAMLLVFTVLQLRLFKQADA